jgi:hypothetical protein
MIAGNSRADAKEKGLKLYFTGNPCKFGHISNRYISNGCCVDCDKSKSQKNYVKNKKTILEVGKNWRQNNPNYNDTWLSNNRNYHKHWRSITKHKYIHTRKVCERRWRLNNPDRIIMYTRIRKQTVKSAIPSWYEHSLINILYKRRNELSVLWDIKLEVDHIIPLNPKDKSVCGLHCWANLQLIDKQINLIKGDRYQTNW